MPNENLDKRYDELVKIWSETRHIHGLSFSRWITELLMRIETERDNWRKQALAEDERANELARRVKELEVHIAN